MGKAAVPGGAVITECGQGGLFTADVDELQILYCVAHQHGIVIVGMVMVAIEGHLDLL